MLVPLPGAVVEGDLLVALPLGEVHLPRGDVRLFVLAHFGEGAVDGDQLRAVGERGLHLHVLDHLRDALHHLLPGKHLPPGRHQVGNGPAVPGPLKDMHDQQGHRLGVVEPHPPGPPLLGDIRRHMNHQALLLMRSQVHCHVPAFAPAQNFCPGPACWDRLFAIGAGVKPPRQFTPCHRRSTASALDRSAPTRRGTILITPAEQKRHCSRPAPKRVVAACKSGLAALLKEQP